MYFDHRLSAKSLVLSFPLFQSTTRMRPSVSFAVALLPWLFTFSRRTNPQRTIVRCQFKKSCDTNSSKLLVIHRTRSGQLILNDTFVQVGVHEMPFGGCGESGCKYYLHNSRTYLFITCFILQMDRIWENSHSIRLLTFAVPSTSQSREFLFTTIAPPSLSCTQCGTIHGTALSAIH
jgi:hypothetical protein